MELVAGMGFIVLTQEIYIAELRVSWFREKKLISPSLEIIKNHEIVWIGEFDSKFQLRRG